MKIIVSSKRGMSVAQVGAFMDRLNGKPRPARLDCCSNRECRKVLSVAEMVERWCEACNAEQPAPINQGGQGA